MRLRLIKILDWIDDRVIRHRFHAICRWVADHPWWGR